MSTPSRGSAEGGVTQLPLLLRVSAQSSSGARRRGADDCLTLEDFAPRVALASMLRPQEYTRVTKVERETTDDD